VLSALFVTGSPPFSMFFSEMLILRAGFMGPHVIATTVFLAALVILFCGFAYQIGSLVLGPQPDQPAMADTERLDFGMIVTIVVAVLAVVTTFYMPQPLFDLIRAAASVVSGGV
jgi:hydrogenase-4 component F